MLARPELLAQHVGKGDFYTSIKTKRRRVLFSPRKSPPVPEGAATTVRFDPKLHK